jgi:hypothetical protein
MADFPPFFTTGLSLRPPFAAYDISDQYHRIVGCSSSHTRPPACSRSPDLRWHRREEGRGDPNSSSEPMLSIRPFALLYIFLIHSFECSRCDALSIAARGCGMRSSSAPSTDHRSIWTRSRPNLDVNIETRTAMVQSLAANLPISRVGSRTSTALQMVLSTPENIIEQASTQKLLDTLLDESVRTQSRHPIMLQFNPSRKWIWRQWRGTVFSETWKSCLTNMALATSVVFLYRIYPSLKENLQGFSILWGQLLSVTTFTLTFFLNQSYGLWRKCYDYSRRLQGRLNDLGMTLAAHATRTKPSSPDVPSTYTPQSRQALELVSRYVRVFNLLTYGELYIYEIGGRDGGVSHAFKQNCAPCGHI